jgi:hypothetical protein
MPTMPRAVAAFACLLLAACPGGDRGEAATRMDTANARWEDGLSTEQVESEARALSPEEAEAAGLTVDTTIHLEVPDAEDTLYLPRANEPTPPPVAPGEGDPAAGTRP